MCRTRAGLALAALVLVAAAVSGQAAQAKEPIRVVMDRAKVMRISAPAETVIVGNPGIADAVMHDRQTLILTGRMAGITNLVVLDAKGQPIADEIINVEKIQEGLVTVQRGNTRMSYFCTPHCASMPEVGDGREAFEGALNQINQRNSLGAAHSGAGAQ
jgi:hypothetical protein